MGFYPCFSSSTNKFTYRGSYADGHPLEFTKFRFNTTLGELMINATNFNVGLYYLKLTALDECLTETSMFVKILINVAPNKSAEDFPVQIGYRF